MRHLLFRTLRVLIVLGVIGAAGVLVWKKLVLIPNHHAYVNGHLVTIRAPIDGTVNLENLRIGQLVKINSELGRIEPLEAAELEQQQHRLLKGILQNETQIAAINERLLRERELLRTYFEKSSTQKQLDLEFAQESVRRATGDLNAAKHAAEIAAKNSQRNDTLVEQGAVQVSVAENDKATADEAVETVRAREAQLAQAQTQLKAAQQGLQLEAPRTLNYADIRIESIQQEIANLHFQIATSTAQIEQDKAELAKVTRRLSKDRTLAAPISGVVWSIDASSGESLRAGDPVVQLLDVSNRWVETYVSESDMDRITVGSPATVLLANGNVAVDARVDTIRAGVNRLSRDDAIGAPTFGLQPQVAVRLAVRWPESLSKELGSDQFLGVGRSVEVLFNCTPQ